MSMKSGWERSTPIYELDLGGASSLFQEYIPGLGVEKIELLAGGLANTNYKCILKNEATPFLLRIFTRDPEACAREVKLHQLVRKIVAVPEIFYHDTSCRLIPHCFSIVEWIEGDSLRDLVQKERVEAAEKVFLEAGLQLAQLKNFSFSRAGFFDKNLDVVPFFSDERENPYIRFMKECLEGDYLPLRLSKKKISQIYRLLEEAKGYYEICLNTHHLVHSDYDPANIFAHQVNGEWKIAAILDWEFASSGSVLSDVGNMLRYEYSFASSYRENFLRGLELGGYSLPKNWHRAVKAIDLLNLCSFLSSPTEHPVRFADTQDLIQRTLAYWFPES